MCVYAAYKTIDIFILFLCVAIKPKRTRVAVFTEIIDACHNVFVVIVVVIAISYQEQWFIVRSKTDIVNALQVCH